MQEEVQRRLSGADPTRGYYCDDKSGRYFPIPKPGTMGYPMYQELKDRIEKEVAAEMAAKKASQKKRRIGSLYNAVWELRSGHAFNRPTEVKFILERAALLHQESPTSELLLGPAKSRLLTSSTQPEHIIAAGSSFIYDFSIAEMTQEAMVAHSCGDVSDLRTHPELPCFSSSSLSGSIQVRSFADLSLQERLASSFQTSIWTHQWMTSKDVFCGCDTQGTLLDVWSGRFTKVYSGKSTIFTAAPARGSEHEILFGTRAGKLFRFDRRKRQSICLEAKESKKDPFVHLEAMSDANYVIGSHTDGSIEMFDLRMLASAMSWSTGNSKLENNARFSISYDQSFLAVAGKDCVVRIFDITLPTEEPIIEAPFGGPVSDIIWSEEWTSKRLRGFGVATGSELRLLPVPLS